jgi:putative DNA primase/helicase
MRQYIFVTTTKDEELFYYDIEKGIYCPDTEWLIKQQCRILHSKIKSYEIEEVIKFIKDSTYIERSLFDSNPDLLNLQNGVLNVHTLEFKEHSPGYYLLSVVPYNYDKKAQCPTIVKFLHDALKSRDDYITAIEIFGYCLYKTAKYEKALLCVGDGDNGKGTFLKLLERFVGLLFLRQTNKKILNLWKKKLAFTRYTRYSQ